MTLLRASVFVAISAVTCAAAGAGIGWFIGTFMPDAYRGWFPWGVEPGFSAAEFGTGVGLVQGLVAGLIIGVILVALVTWHDIRTKAEHSG